MKLILEAVAVELDHSGHIKSRLSDCSDISLKLDGAEIDGASFSFSDKGDKMQITMTTGEGIELSDEIKTNYPAPPHSAVMQISFKEPAARFTANTLNKLMRRVNKEFPNKAILIREVRNLIG